MFNYITIYITVATTCITVAKKDSSKKITFPGLAYNSVVLEKTRGGQILNSSLVHLISFRMIQKLNLWKNNFSNKCSNIQTKGKDLLIGRILIERENKSVYLLY
jgi:hypothetical protein